MLVFAARLRHTGKTGKAKCLKGEVAERSKALDWNRALTTKNPRKSKGLCLSTIAFHAQSRHINDTRKCCEK